MRNIMVSVQEALSSLGRFLVGGDARWRRLAIAAILVIGSCDTVCGLAADAAPKTEGGQGAVEEKSGKTQTGPPAGIEGFREARFGMNEEQVRQAIRRDFPAAAGKVASATHPAEKTTVLSVTVADLLPHTGNARISYILGYRSKKLSQINIIWSSGSAGGDETVVGTANALRDYFSSENFKPESVVANYQLAPHTILVFRGSDEQKRTVLLVLNGEAASASSEEKKTPKPPPLTLELSYIEDAAHPDIFRIGKGQF
jgi:hypothetical protein